MKNKSRIILSTVGVALSLALLIANTILVENEMIGTTFGIILIAISVILIFVAIFYAAKIDYQTGMYECKKCGNTFKPTLMAYIWGAHTLNTRYLKCPKCEENSWCRVRR